MVMCDQARNMTMPTGGVYVAQSGFVLDRAHVTPLRHLTAPLSPHSQQGNPAAETLWRPLSCVPSVDAVCLLLHPFLIWADARLLNIWF